MKTEHLLCLKRNLSSSNASGFLTYLLFSHKPLELKQTCTHILREAPFCSNAQAHKLSEESKMAGITKVWPKIKRLSFIPINANGSTR